MAKEIDITLESRIDSEWCSRLMRNNVHVIAIFMADRMMRTSDIDVFLNGFVCGVHLAARELVGKENVSGL
jgi:hypothetical protein